MSNRTRRVVAVLGAAVLAVPSVAAAAPGKGKGPAKSGATTETQAGGKVESRAKAKGKGKGKGKKVKLATYVVKGVYDEAGQVDVTGGNSHTRRAGLVRDNVVFEFGSAKLAVADTNADGTVTRADIQAGDRLTIQLKLPRTLGEGPYTARKVVDRTHPPVDETETETETDTKTETETETPPAGSPVDEPDTTDAE